MKWLGIAVGVIVVGGGLWWVLGRGNSARMEESSRTPKTQPQNTSNKSDASVTPGDPADVTLQGQKLAANYRVFTKADYEALRAARTPIFLYFYANWCPTCAAQEPIMVQTFNNRGEGGGVIGLRVNYNDSDADADEQKLAEEFGVRYQHTFFLLDGNGDQVAKLLGQNSESQLNKTFAKVK